MDSLFWNTAKEGRAWLTISRNMAKGTDIRKATGLDTAAWSDAQSQAVRELDDAGIEKTTRNIDRRAFEIVEAARDAATTHDARKWGAHTTYNYDPEGTMGALAGAINGFIQRVPIARAAVPFVRILANITDKNLDWSGLGLVRALRKSGHIFNGGDIELSARDRMEKAISGALGLTAFAAFYAMARAHAGDDDDKVPFMLYGMGPKDPARRQQMPRGWKPFCMKIGSHYIDFSGTPLAFVLGTVGTAMDQERYGDPRGKQESGERALMLLTAAPKTLLGSGVLSSMKDTMDMLTGDRRPGAWSERMAAGFIPAASMLRDIATAIDPQQVDSTTFGATFLSYLPVVRGDQRPALNVFGDPVKVPGPWLLQRLIRNQDRTDPEAVWLTQNKLAIPGLDNEIAVGTWLTKSDKPKSAGGLLPDRAFRAEILDRLTNGYLTADERYTLQSITGPRIRKAVKILQQQQARGQKIEQDEVTRAVSAIRRKAMKELIR